MGAFVLKDYKEFCKNQNIEIEHCPHRMHTGNWVVERAIQTMKTLFTANLPKKKLKR